MLRSVPMLLLTVFLTALAPGASFGQDKDKPSDPGPAKKKAKEPQEGAPGAKGRGFGILDHAIKQAADTTHKAEKGAADATHKAEKGAAATIHKAEKGAAAESHKLQANTAKESHKLQSDAAKQSHKLQSNAANESHKLQSNAGRKVVHFNKWWNDKVMGGDARRHRMMSWARELRQMYESWYEADRRKALSSLGWTTTQIAIFEQLNGPPGTFQATEYAALYDVLFDMSYASVATKYGHTGRPLTDAVVNNFPGTARQNALNVWGQYYGIKMSRTNGSLRLDDDSGDVQDGTITDPGYVSETKDPQTGNVIQIDFGTDPPIINGQASVTSSTTGDATSDGTGSSNGTGSNPAPGGTGSGGNSSGTGAGGNSGQNASGGSQHPTTGSTGGNSTDTSYADWSRNRFAQEYKQFETKLRSQLTGIEDGAGKLWIRYGDKVRDFARDMVKEKVKDALGKLPGGSAAVKAMGVFNELLATRQELAAAPTLKTHPGAKLVAPAVDSESPDEFLKGMFAGPTDIRAISLAQKGYTAWKSPTGVWFYDRNPRLSPSEYETVIPPHGNPVSGNAKPTGISDKTILIHHFSKLASGILKRS